MNQYVTRVHSFLQDGTPDNDVLLYYNIADVMSEQGNRSLQHFSGLDRNMLESSVRESAVTLTENGYAWDMISDKQLLKTNIEKEMIVTPGAAYKTVLVSAAQYIPYETMEKLMALADEGATVVFYKGIPQDMAGMILSEEKQAHFKEMLDALDFHAEGAVKCARVGKGKICLSDDINALMNEANVGAEKMYQAGLQCIRRNSATGKYYFIENSSDRKIEDWIPLRTEARSAAIFNPMTGASGLATMKRNDGQTDVYLELNPGETVIVSTSSQNFTGDAYAYYQNAGEPNPVSGSWTVSFVQGGPQLPASITVDSLGSWTDFVGDVGNIVLRDRQHLAEDGIMIVVLTLERGSNQLLAGPDIVSRGFVYVRESEDLMEEARQVVTDAVEDCLNHQRNADWSKIKLVIRDTMNEFIWKKTKRRPMIMPIIMEV